MGPELDAWKLLDALCDGLLVVDAEARLLWLNASLRRRDGDGRLRPGDAFATAAAQFFTPGAALDELSRGLGEVLHGRSQRCDVDCGGARERRYRVIIRPCPVAGARGALLQLIDTTARTAADAEVRESEARWRSLIDGSPDIVFITDAASRMIYANRALEELCGYTVADFQMRQGENCFIHAEDRERVARFIAEFVAGDRTFSDRIENRFVTRSGRVIHVDSVVSKTRYHGQPALQFVCHDVTVEREALAESARRLVEAERAIASRDEFLSIAAHELKTPLTSLRGYAQLLSQPPVDAERVQRGLRVIDRQVTKLTRLVNRLLDLTQLEEGRLALDRQPADLVAIARDAITTAARPKQAEIRLDAPERLVASVDPLRLEQVIVNLVENALRYGPADGTVQVLLRDLGGLAAIDVVDQGHGVPPAERERVFERFYRLPACPPGGMGLGLYLAAQIVQLHGGRISVSAAEGGGARFSVVLPVEAPAPGLHVATAPGP